MGDALDEHIEYLSDAVRLERFERAVARQIAPGDTVADVGCGFGILGLMCLEAGASHVWGIDRSDAIEIARETARRGGFAERYTCLHEVSFRAELPERVDVVICDHVGYFGFDYGIIGALGDARRRFLKPGGKVIPQRLALEVAAVRSPGCRALAEAWAAEPIPAAYHWLSEYAVNRKYPYDFTPAEIASDAAELGTIDLRADSPDHLAFTARLEIREDGALDGLAGWFGCEIADGVRMSNSPLAPDRIGRSQAFLPFAAPLPALAGDIVAVAISVRHESLQLSWTARVERTGQTARQSTWKSTILSPEDRVPASERVPRLSATGEARRALLALVDGQATSDEIEQAMLRDHPDLYPSPDQLARFVRNELHRSTQ